MPKFSCVIKEQTPSPLRLDRYVSENLRLLSRSQIKARSLKASVNGKEVKISRLVKEGELIELVWDDQPPLELVPQDLPLDILYEDDQCVVINKSQGMVVHPGAGNRQGTLANALYFRRINKNVNEAKSMRPGIVHRLDKETSGVIIAAYNDEAHAFLADQFKSRKTRKNYIAIVQGNPEEIKGRIETFIARDPKDRKRFTVSANGRSAFTAYKVIKNWENYSLLLLRPRTGRTHQLRVHLRYIGSPVLGDPVYGNPDSLFPDVSLMLHSKSLAVTLPGETEEKIFTAPVPDRFIAVIEKLDRMRPNG
ncbi:MAG: RluA family pseudouridine synthase [Treponema sp.]|nr:RluA family pseudouridine synthase [Treponema sp.]